jgi:hypothetical protein
MLVFAIIDAPGSMLTGMKLLFDDGYPRNHDIISTDAGNWDLIMVPELVSISPRQGSIGGTRLEINIPGLAVGQEVEVGTDDADQVCTETRVESFGKIICVTKPMQI